MRDLTSVRLARRPLVAVSTAVPTGSADLYAHTGTYTRDTYHGRRRPVAAPLVPATGPKAYDRLSSDRADVDYGGSSSSATGAGGTAEDCCDG